MTIETRTDRDRLTALAKALNGWDGIHVEVSAPDGGTPFLKATNTHVPMLTERITVEDGHFLWSWGEPISQVHDVATAALSIARTVRDQR